MPHKHTRRKDGNTASDFNLAPSTIAKPLPAFSKPTKPNTKPHEAQRQKLKRKRTGTGTADYKEDDTPRAFARMMQFQATKKRPSGLDDGTERSKRKKKQNPNPKESVPTQAPKATPAIAEVPKILPGERLADYSARVDQALPMGNLTRKGKTNIEGVKERRTKTEKRLHKMYAAWREDDARRKEKLEEAQELAEEEEDEKQAEYGGQDTALPQSRKMKRRKMVGEAAADDDDDEDPWKVLEERREKPRGLHDVVQAPPTLKVVPREKFKVRNGAKVEVANVPAAAGSLKRREELGDARREVIERYRAMMKGKGEV